MGESMGEFKRERSGCRTKAASCLSSLFCFFFFNDTATTEIYTLSLHDALPIWHFPIRRLVSTIHVALSPELPLLLEGTLASTLPGPMRRPRFAGSLLLRIDPPYANSHAGGGGEARSEEHTSELQSHSDLVCRLLLEKKKTTKKAGKTIQ